MIIGKEKLFQKACRMRYCVAMILLQKSQSFFGDTFVDSVIFNNLKRKTNDVYSSFFKLHSYEKHKEKPNVHISLFRHERLFSNYSHMD